MYYTNDGRINVMLITLWFSLIANHLVESNVVLIILWFSLISNHLVESDVVLIILWFSLIYILISLLGKKGVESKRKRQLRA